MHTHFYCGLIMCIHPLFPYGGDIGRKEIVENGYIDQKMLFNCFMVYSNYVFAQV